MFCDAFWNRTGKETELTLDHVWQRISRSSRYPGTKAGRFSILEGLSGSLNRIAVKSEESSELRHPVTDEEWQRRLAAVREAIVQCDGPYFTRLAEHIAQLIDGLDPWMTKCCGLTCPTCSDRCCEGRKIFYNRTDLIYQAALGQVRVPGQTREQEGLECRYFSRNGCLLNRGIRPYVCVWYLCEPQVELLKLEPVREQRRITETLQEIRRARLLLESLYETRSF